MADSARPLGSPAEAGGSGPLAGVRVVEFAGMGPGPFAAMMLADMGASVVRVDRVGNVGEPARDLVVRGRQSVALDLKSDAGVDVALRLVSRADVLIEGFRPGVMERLGLSPERCVEVNPGLVYGRMTGWGQNGPWAARAGHDIDYIALSGVLGMIGRSGHVPAPPLNLIGDLGGGGCMLAFGVVCALLERAQHGRGQIVDASMLEGSTLLMTMFFGAPWSTTRGARGTNMLDSGAPFYDCYPTSDDRLLAVGAIEAQFYENFVAGLGLPHAAMFPQHDRAQWPARKVLVAERIAERPLDDWVTLFRDRDACVEPVLEMDELESHPQHAARHTLIPVAGVTQPAPTPRFSRTAPGPPQPAPRVGQDSTTVLEAAGYSRESIDLLLHRGAVAQA